MRRQHEKACSLPHPQVHCCEEAGGQASITLDGAPAGRPGGHGEPGSCPCPTASGRAGRKGRRTCEAGPTAVTIMRPKPESTLEPPSSEGRETGSLPTSSDSPVRCDSSTLQSEWWWWWWVVGGLGGLRGVG